jgi:hypothetical protein
LKIKQTILDRILWRDVVSQTFSNVASAIVFSLLALVIVDQFFSTPRLSGVWRVDMTTNTADLSDYQGLELTYLVTLAQGSLEFSGSGDKFAERSKIDADWKELSGAAKTPIEFVGYVEKNYFSSDVVHVTVSEKGLLRESATFYELTVIDVNQLAGVFRSTISNSAGTVKWTRM